MTVFGRWHISFLCVCVYSFADFRWWNQLLNKNYTFQSILCICLNDFLSFYSVFIDITGPLSFHTIFTYNFFYILHTFFFVSFDERKFNETVPKLYVNRTKKHQNTISKLKTNFDWQKNKKPKHSQRSDSIQFDECWVNDFNNTL